MTAQPEFPIVTLCGSTRFKEIFRAVERRLTLEGWLVVSLGAFGQVEGMDYDGRDSETKRMLDRMHRAKIDLAQRVHVINRDMYLGESTHCEIRYAYSQGKRVTFEFVMGDDHHDGRPHGLCMHGEPRGTCPGIDSWRILCHHPEGYHA